MDKYLSVITNFGCHGRCPYCIVWENGIKVPKSTVDGLDKLEDAITLTGANIVSISGGGDPLYRYSDNPLVPMYLGMVMGICIKAGIPMEMHTSYTESEFPYHFCKRVVYHLQSVEGVKREMMRKLYNLWLRYKTKNFTKIPLFTMVFDYQKFRENGKGKSCVLYAIHPDIVTDEFLKGKLQECVDYIRDNYDMERFTEI